MDIGLPPASPSDKDIDLKVHSFDSYKHYLSSLQNDSSNKPVWTKRRSDDRTVCLTI